MKKLLIAIIAVGLFLAIPATSLAATTCTTTHYGNTTIVICNGTNTFHSFVSVVNIANTGGNTVTGGGSSTTGNATAITHITITGGTNVVHY